MCLLLVPIWPSVGSFQLVLTNQTSGGQCIPIQTKQSCDTCGITWLLLSPLMDYNANEDVLCKQCTWCGPSLHTRCIDIHSSLSQFCTHDKVIFQDCHMDVLYCWYQELQHVGLLILCRWGWHLQKGFQLNKEQWSHQISTMTFCLFLFATLVTTLKHLSPGYFCFNGSHFSPWDAALAQKE